MKKVLLGFIVFLLFSVISAMPEVTLMSNTVSSRLGQATRLNQLAPNQPLHILVWLKGQNPEQLQNLLHSLYTPGNAQYHKFLSAEQYKTLYAPTDANVNAVKQYLIAQGLNVDSVPANNAFISVRTTVAHAEQAFGVTINNYHFNGKVSFSNDRAVALEANIATLISGISGLNNFAKIQHGAVKATNQAAGGLPSSYSPQNIQVAYGVDKLLNNGIDGSGQTIALIDACDDPSVESDLNAYSSRYFLPACTSESGCIAIFNESGGTTPAQCSAVVAGWDSEISLDTQSVHGLAPGAKIVLFEAESSSAVDLYATLNTAISLGYNIISNSWGYMEADGEAAPFDEITLQQAAAVGISVSASSGDHADYVEAAGYPTVNYPASSSWITAVGGSSLLLTSDGRYINEVGWAWPFVSQGQIWGSTGGLSQYFTGQGAQTSAISNVTAGGYGIVGNKRAVPDISMVGDPNTGITIVDSNQDPAWFGEGGTSLSSPLFAAVTALANQARDQQGLPGVGLVAPLLYSMEYSKFQGVVPITNIAGPVQVDTSVLSGIAGWNDMTGLGSPYVPLFVQALVDSK